MQALTDWKQPFMSTRTAISQFKGVLGTTLCVQVEQRTHSLTLIVVNVAVSQVC